LDALWLSAVISNKRLAVKAAQFTSYGDKQVLARGGYLDWVFDPNKKALPIHPSVFLKLNTTVKIPCLVIHRNPNESSS
jgi:hypothetical protein